MTRLSTPVVVSILTYLPAMLYAGKDIWTPIGPGDATIESLAFNPQNPQTLYAGTPGGMFKSTDGGTNWKLVNATHLAPKQAAIDPRNPNTMYAGLPYGTAPNGGPWLFKSTDEGANWTVSNSGLEGSQFAGGRAGLHRVLACRRPTVRSSPSSSIRKTRGLSTRA